MHTFAVPNLRRIRGIPMKAIFVLFDSLCRTAMGCYGPTPRAHAELRPLRAARDHVRHALRRQPAVHAGAPRPAHRAASTSCTGAGGRWSRSTTRSRSRCATPASIRISSPITCTTSRTAARRTTGAFAPGTSSAARSTTRGRRWCEPPLERLREKYAQRALSTFDRQWSKRLQHAINTRVHAGRGGLLPAALLRSRRSSSSTTIVGGQLVPDARMLRSARAVPGAEALQGPYPTGWTGGVLDWPMLREGRRLPRWRSPRSAPTTRRWSPRAITTSASCSTTSTSTTCGRTRRSMLSTDHGFLLGRARLVGQEPDAVLHRDLAHPAASSITRDCAQHGGTAPQRADADDGPDADVPRSRSACRCRRKCGRSRCCRCSTARRRSATSASSACSAVRSARPTAATRTTSIPRICTRRGCTSTR